MGMHLSSVAAAATLTPGLPPLRETMHACMHA